MLTGSQLSEHSMPIYRSASPLLTTSNPQDGPYKALQKHGATLYSHHRATHIRHMVRSTMATSGATNTHTAYTHATETGTQWLPTKHTTRVVTSNSLFVCITSPLGVPRCRSLYIPSTARETRGFISWDDNTRHTHTNTDTQGQGENKRQVHG